MRRALVRARALMRAGHQPGMKIAPIFNQTLRLF